MSKPRNLYEFSGTAYINGNNCGNYHADVVAVSKEQGLNMLRYRFKKERNVDQYSHVVLDGKMTFIEQID